MRRWGSFEETGRLSSAPRVHIAAVVRSGGGDDRRYIVKATRTIVGVDGPEEAAAMRRQFQQATEVWRRASEGSSRWAPVIETGEDDGQAWLVTERYDRTAADLARSWKITSGRLKELLTGTIEGLQALHVACGRGHGNLKSTSILIRSGPGSPLGEVVLWDPAPESPEDDAGDVRALGQLIRELVTGRGERTGGSAAEDEAADWRRFEAWRELALELEGASGSGPELSAVLDRVRRMADDRSRAPLVMGAGAGVLVLAGLMTYFLVGRGPRLLTSEERAEAWKTICVEYDSWCGPLVVAYRDAMQGAKRRAEDDELQAKLEAGPLGELRGHLEAIEDVFRDIKPDKKGQLKIANSDLLLDPEAERPWKDLSEAKFSAALSTLQSTILEVRADLEGEQWTLVTQARQDRQKLDGVGFTGVAAYIGRLLEGIDPDAEVEGVPRAERIAQNVVALARTADARRALLSLWPRLQEAIAASTEWRGGRDDPVLMAARERVRDIRTDAAADAGWSVRDLLQLAVRTKKWADAFSSVQDFVMDTGEEGWDHVHAELFRREGAVFQTAGPVGPSDLMTWIEEARTYVRLPPDELDLLGGDMTGFRGDIQAIRDGLGEEDETIRSCLTDLDGLEQRLSALRAGVWVKAHEAEARETLRLLESELTTIEAKVKGIDPSEFGAIVQLFDGSPALLTRSWQMIRDQLLEGNQNGDVPAYRLQIALDELRATQERIRDALSTSASLPEAPASWKVPAIVAAIEHEQLACLQAVVTGVEQAWIASQGNRVAAPSYALPEIGEELLEAQALRLQDWVASVSRMMADLARAERAVESFRRLDDRIEGETLEEMVDRWMVQSKDIYEAVGGDATFSPLAVTVRSLEAIPKEARAALIDRVRASESAIVPAVAAWHQLESTQPAWPSSAEELGEALEQLAAMRSAIRDLPAARFEREQDRSEVLADLDESVRRRWVQSVERMMGRAGNEAELDAAFALMDDYGVTADLLPVPARFNLRRYELASLLAGGERPPDAELATIMDQIADAGSAGSEFQGRPDVSSALRGLEAVRAEASAGTTDASEIAGAAGPASLARGAWRGQVEDEEGRRLRFTSPDGAHSIEFALCVEEPDAGAKGRLVYLCTTELSVDVAAAIIEESGGFDQDLRSAWDDQIGKATWNGPRTWRFNELTESLAVERDPRQWIQWDAGIAKPELDPAVSVGMPAIVMHPPLNHVSYAAASLIAERIGCRLPSRSEWLAGATFENKDDPAWNLRDGTFDLQVARASQRRGEGERFPTPDDEIFRPGDGVLATGVNATSGPARGGGDSTFLFADTTSGPGRTFTNLFGNVAEFVDLGRGEPGVIGGSALSPPELAIDQPQSSGERFSLAVSETYGDVGVRLAFEAEGSLRQSLARLLSGWLDEHPYVALAP